MRLKSCVFLKIVIFIEALCLTFGTFLIALRGKIGTNNVMTVLACGFTTNKKGFERKNERKLIKKSLSDGYLNVILVSSTALSKIR